MKLEQSILVRPLSHILSGAHVATPSQGYFASLLRGIWSTLSAYLLLLKLRSATLNSLSALVGSCLAAGSHIPGKAAFISTFAVWLAAAGSGALNSYIDRDIDKVMHRTCGRPLPLGIIKPAEKALYAGIFLVAIGLIISAVWLNLFVTLFIASGAAIYIFFYTMWLKKRTPLSIVVGGFAGICALLAGWSAVTAHFSLSSLLFSIFVYLWTIGHFGGIAIKIKDDSERANIPTLSTVYGEKEASKWTALSNMALFPLSIIPYLLGILNEVYLFISLIIGAIVLTVNIKLYFSPTTQNAWTVFKLSSPYLAIVYLAAIVDILVK